MMMEKLSLLLIDNLGRYEKGLRLPQIPPIKSVWVVDQASLNLKAKKKVTVAVEIILNRGFNEILNAYDRFFENPSDPEGVHQVRVRIRKFRAVLGFFRPLFKAESYLRQQQTLRKMGQQFGEVRQLDVLLAGIAEIEKNASFKSGAFGKLSDYLQGQRENALEQLLAGLKTDVFALALLDIWVWKLNDPWAAGAPDLQLSIKDYADRQIDKWLKKIRRSMKNLDVKDPQMVHQVRIKSKKLRYAIEQLATILDRKTRKSLDTFEKMQDDLGYYHDVFANQQLLEQLIVVSPDCQLHGQAGIIIGWQMMAGNRKIRKFIN